MEQGDGYSFSEFQPLHAWQTNWPTAGRAVVNILDTNTPPSFTGQPVMLPDGTLWSWVAIEYTPNLANGFIGGPSNILATPPTNIVTIPATNGSYFFRLRF